MGIGTVEGVDENKSTRILIVEDEKPAAEVLRIKLTTAGFEVVPAYDGEEAIEILKKEKFDLVLLDLVMPKIDGFEVMGQLKALNIDVPVVVLSNLSQAEDERKAQALGAKGFLVKADYSLESLVAYVKKMTGRD